MIIRPYGIGNGYNAMHMGRLPDGISGLCNSMIEHQELCVRAAITGSKHTALLATLADPLTQVVMSIDDAANMLDEMFICSQGKIPDFSH